MNQAFSAANQRRPFRAERAGLPNEAASLPPIPRGEEMSAVPAKPPESAPDLSAIQASLDEMKAMLSALVPQQGMVVAQAEAPGKAADAESDQDLAVRIEIARMVKMIGQAKSEIAHIKHPGDENNQIEDARSELDAIVSDTANATDEILNQAEMQMDLMTRLAGAIAGDSEAEALCAKIEETTIKIMESCNFQDLTGQRTTKVITTLRHIEERIVAMIGIWGIEAFEELPVPQSENDGDEALLNGPAKAGEGISQADIDALFD